ncbi:tRNA (guanine(10)-N(2))-dimethyltransferase [Candidatus Micrarchaeota archaeon]|nr:tRNA (guanine(10)-N(2))-dimethyltransferase [Candidatus Micrarchaeota archaeon]
MTAKGDSLEEEGISFTAPEEVFYNPSMRFCRSISSLAVGAVQKEVDVVDAFCASGIRGIRYAKENSNVDSITFLDLEASAIKAAEKNSRSNGLGAEFKQGNISRLAFECATDFLEIDPFGTPSPYLVDGFRFFNPKKTAYLSVTATDVAVLCGAKTAPCLKNYHSKPLNNGFTHETGLRILIKRIAEVAAEFNMGIEPLVSFSDRHYLKTIMKATRGADLAFQSMKSLGHLHYCSKCGFRGHGRFPEPACRNCGHENDYAGPLWLGELHQKQFIESMGRLNQERQYSDKSEISGFLSLLENETGFPPYYYNVHQLSRFLGKGRIPKLGTIVERLDSKGYRTVRTHFSSTSIKTPAPYSEILEALEWKS